MKKSKKIFIIIIVLLILVLAGAGIYAYFTYNTGKENNVILGYNKISLDEEYDPPLKMEKGISFTKKPYVTNKGNVDCYVRVKSKVSDSRVEKDITIDYNSSQDINDTSKEWYYNVQDGYYYYKNELKPGEKTEDLFTTVEISETADDLILDGFDIYLYAESVQTVKDKTMSEVWNYFNT